MNRSPWSLSSRCISGTPLLGFRTPPGPLSIPRCRESHPEWRPAGRRGPSGLPWRSTTAGAAFFREARRPCPHPSRQSLSCISSVVAQRRACRSSGARRTLRLSAQSTSRPGFRSAHNRAYWSGSDYLGIGPSAFSTVSMTRWQNVSDFRAYADVVLSGKSAMRSVEQLTTEMKRAERIALGLRTIDGAPAQLLEAFPDETREFVRLGLLQETRGNLVLTTAGKALADSVAEAFV